VGNFARAKNRSGTSRFGHEGTFLGKAREERVQKGRDMVLARRVHRFEIVSATAARSGKLGKRLRMDIRRLPVRTPSMTPFSVASPQTSIR
jgi:hypothetical protein